MTTETQMNPDVTDVESWLEENTKTVVVAVRRDVLRAELMRLREEAARLRAEREAYRTAWEAVRSTFNDMLAHKSADSDVVEELDGLFDRYGAVTDLIGTEEKR